MQDVWRTCQLGEEVPRCWDEIVVPWSQAKQSKKTWRDLRWHLRILDQYCQGKLLQDIKLPGLEGAPLKF